MARLIAFFLAVVVSAVLVSALYFAPAPMREVAGQQPNGMVSGVEAAGPGLSSGEKPAPKTAAPVHGAARDVGSGMVASTVAPGTVLERIESAALPQTIKSQADTNERPSDAPKRWRVVYNSVITAAGVFDLNGMSIVLPGIDVVSADENCTANDGRQWPCGAAARTAFRAYVRNRALNCHLPVTRPEDAIAAECLLQGEDPAQWLVAQGWARAANGGSYAGLGLQAKAAAKGIFGNPPTGVGINAEFEAVGTPGAVPGQSTSR